MVVTVQSIYEVGDLILKLYFPDTFDFVKEFVVYNGVRNCFCYMGYSFKCFS